MSKQVEIIGLEEFTGDLKKMSAAMRNDTVVDSLEAGAQAIVAYAQDNARTKLSQHPTGNLVNNIGVRRDGKSVLAGVFGVVYAKIHEFGGIITPRNGPYLAFEIDGQWVFTKKVSIPARPYLRPAVDVHVEEIKNAIIESLRGLLRGAI